jgi:Rrf2 family protein
LRGTTSTTQFPSDPSILEDCILVRISHKVDYGLRAVVALARMPQDQAGIRLKRETLATQENLPSGFLDDILRALRNAGLVRSHRGPDGGWTLARDATDITVADIIRALEGPLASVRGIRPNELPDHGVQEPFVSLWVSVRAALRSVLEEVSVADLAAGRLPAGVVALVDAPGAWDVP